MSDSSKLFLRFSKIDHSLTEDKYKSLVQNAFQKLANIEVDPANVTLVEDRDYGGFRNFCFVMMETPEQAGEVIDAMDGFDYEDAQISVSVAKPRENRTGGGGGSYGGGNGGGRGGYNNNRNNY